MLTGAFFNHWENGVEERQRSAHLPGGVWVPIVALSYSERAVPTGISTCIFWSNLGGLVAPGWPQLGEA